MPVERANAEVRAELEDVRQALEGERPELADRLARVVEQLAPADSPDPKAYWSTGAAATRLGVSPNTIKKCVRTGVIRDFWVMPGSGYIKIAPAEIDRLRGAGASEES
jgi:hypothetical protein